MRLTKEQIEKISALVLDALKKKELIVFKADEKSVIERVNHIILEDLRAEETLDREVDEMLKAHAASISSGQVDYRRMFSMIKTKLAKERGIVL